MGVVRLWFHPRCSKCRRAVELLEERGQSYELRRYLDEPPRREELERLLRELGTADPRALMRVDEPAYAERGLADAGPRALLDALQAQPALLQRPIAELGERAVVARPPERVLELL